MNEGKASLFSKMAAVMGELNRLPKNGHNKFFDYNFVEDGDVFDAVRKHLAAHGLAFFASMPDFEQSETVNEKGKASIRTLATFEFTFGCADTGEYMTFKWTGEAVGNDDKGLNKASTAALKYFLLKTFVLSSGDDPDASDSTATTVTKSTKPTTAAKRTNPYTGAAKPTISHITKIETKQKRDGSGVFYQMTLQDGKTAYAFTRKVLEPWAFEDDTADWNEVGFAMEFETPIPVYVKLTSRDGGDPYLNIERALTFEEAAKEAA